MNRYLSVADDEFVWAVDQDIRAFLEKANQKSVLIFPPVNNYRRFLIHKVSESLVVGGGELGHRHELVTFSIGTGSERRTVVCFRHQLLRDVKATSSKSFEESTDGAAPPPPPAPQQYQPQLSWRSSTVGPTTATTTVSSASAASHTNCSVSNSSNNSTSNCASVSSSSSGSKSKKRSKRDPSGGSSLTAAQAGSVANSSESSSSSSSNSKKCSCC